MAKDRADNLIKIYIWQLVRAGLSSGYGLFLDINYDGDTVAHVSSKGKYIKISYPNSSITQNIKLTKTSCHIAGQRFWFECPHCERRIAVLYLCDEGYFSCRVCLNLTYKSKNKNYRSKDYDLLRCADNYIKANELLDQIKRYSYRGQDTKKWKKIGQLYANSLL